MTLREELLEGLSMIWDEELTSDQWFQIARSEYLTRWRAEMQYPSLSYEITQCYDCRRNLNHRGPCVGMKITIEPKNAGKPAAVGDLIKIVFTVDVVPEPLHKPLSRLTGISDYIPSSD